MVGVWKLATVFIVGATSASVSLGNQSFPHSSRDSTCLASASAVAPRLICNSADARGFFYDWEGEGEGKNSVDCGDHEASSCANCVQGGEELDVDTCDEDCRVCRGSCVDESEPCWMSFAEWKVDVQKTGWQTKRTDINCGLLRARTCAECPRAVSSAGSTFLCNNDCALITVEGSGICMAKARLIDFISKETGCEADEILEPLQTSLLDISCSNIQEMKVGVLVGVGSQRAVFKASWKSRMYAVKILKRYIPSTSPEENSASPQVREARLLQTLRGQPNIENLRGFCDGVIVTDLAVSDLESMVLRDLSQKRKLELALEVARSIEQLHLIPVAHADLHVNQFLILGDGALVLTDLDSWRYVGMSRLARGERCLAFWEGSRFGAPEQFEGAFSEKADIFSMANVIFRVLATRENFFTNFNSHEIKERIRTGDRPDLRQLQYPQEVSKILADCWQAEPSLRPAASEVVNTIEKVLKELFDE